MGSFLLFIGFVIVMNLIGSKIAGEHRISTKKCEKVHKWVYNENGFLQCENCRRFPGDGQ